MSNPFPEAAGTGLARWIAPADEQEGLAIEPYARAFSTQETEDQTRTERGRAFSANRHQHGEALGGKRHVCGALACLRAWERKSGPLARSSEVHRGGLKRTRVERLRVEQ